MDVDIPQEVDVPRGKVHVARDLQHGLHLEAAPGKLHIPRDGGHQQGAVLADLRIPALGKGHGLAALGGDLGVQHRPPRLALGGLDEPADLLALLHVVDQVQGGVVHPVELIHLQNADRLSREIVHDVAVGPVKGGLPHGGQEEGKVLFPLRGQPFDPMGVHAVEDPVLRHGPVEHLLGDLLPIAHRREHDAPSIELIRREEEAGLGVQDQLILLFRALLRPLLLILVLLLGVLLRLVLGLGLPQAGGALSHQHGLQPLPLDLHHLLGQDAVLIQTEVGRGQIARLLTAQMVQPVKRVLRWQLQLGEVDLPRRFRRLSRLRLRRLDGGGLLLRRFLLLLPEQQLRQLTFQ